MRENRIIKFRCFYDGKMYPVKELFGMNGMSVNAIEMELEGLGLRTVSPSSERVDGLMQFTGMYDRDEKEVYEGDILYDEYADEQNNDFHRTVVRVFFQNGAFVAMANGGIYCECLSEIGGDFYVAGNIYENPELLKFNSPENQNRDNMIIGYKQPES